MELVIMKIKIIYILLLFWIFSASMCIESRAQVEDLIKRYAGENAVGYIEPLITGFGANLNSGLYRNANIPQFGLHINFGINGTMAIFSNKQRKFTATTTGYFYPVQQVETSTIIGNPRGTVVTSPTGTEYVFPGGYNLKSFLIGIPQVAVGSFAGTEATIRYFRARLNSNIGDLALFGIGVRHSVSQYFPTLPMDIAAGFFYHKFKIGTIVKSDVYCFHAELGKSFKIVNIYSGLAFESNKAHVEYEFDSTVAAEDVSIDVVGKNKFRITLGVGFNLKLFHINLDYNLGYQNVINTGVSIGF
jgi:hypothetical protein